jgi:thiazole/oxazole-forming peptide maturase SagD family component
VPYKSISDDKKSDMFKYLIDESIIIKDETRSQLDNSSELREFFSSLDKNTLIVGPEYLSACTQEERLQFINYNNLENIEDQLKSSNCKMVLTLFNIYNVKDLIKLNKIAEKQEKSILNMIITKHKEVFVGPYISKNSIGCVECLLKRMAMCNAYLDKKLQLVDQLKKVLVNSLSDSDSLKGLWGHIKEAKDIIIENSRKNIVSNTVSIEVIEETEVVKKEAHKLLPCPNCSKCLERFNKLGKESLKELNINDAVSAKVGLITHVDISMPKERDPKVIISVSSSSDFSKINKHMQRIGNSGAGFDAESAEQSAIGESLERYAASYINFDEIIVDSYKGMEDKGHKLVKPEEFELFSEGQYNAQAFPYKKFNKNTVIGWSECYRYSNEESVFVPSAFIYIPYIKNDDEEVITPYISTGLAAGQTRENAILSGIYEVVERDSFSVTWLTKLPPAAKVDLAVLPNFKDIFTDNLKYTAYDISLDIPLRTVFAMVEGNLEGRNVLSVGASTRLTIEEALKKALIEATQGRNYVNDLVDYFKDLELKDNFGNIDTFQKHALFYTKFEHMRDRANFLLDKEVTEYRKQLFEEDKAEIEGVDKLPIKAKLNYVVKRIEQLGYTVIVKDLTPIDLKLLNVHVVRVIIPGLHGLHGTHKFRYLGGRRFAEVNRKCGRENYEINRYPHPFP